MESLFNSSDAGCSSSSSRGQGGNQVQKLLQHISNNPAASHSLPPPPLAARPRLDQPNISRFEANLFDSVFNDTQEQFSHIQPPMPMAHSIDHPPVVSWAQEFNSDFNHHVSTADFEEMERRFQMHNISTTTGKQPDAWSVNEFEQFADSHALDRAFDEFKSFDVDFPAVSEAISAAAFHQSEFGTHENDGVNALQHQQPEEDGHFDGDMWANEFLRQQQERMPSGPYPFEPENPYMNEEPDRILDLASQLKANGNLSDAALAYEAHLQRNPGDANAWATLGQLQAENEKEIPAILALKQCLELDGNHLDGLLALAVSYTNEGYDDEAYRLLYKWTCTYHNIPVKAEYEQILSFELYNMATDILLGKIQQQSAGAIDHQTQIALGLIFYNSGQHEKSIDCFRTALTVRPDDYTLWNRVGATLANSGQSEQAIDAYYKALHIKPGFVRARYNLGVSCMNIGCYKDAAEHFLNALTLCGQGNNVPESLWETLRRCFVLMERGDLADMAKTGASLDLFRKDFDF